MKNERKYKNRHYSLGCVGSPLARLFATKYPVVGFDINEGSVNELKKGIDSTLEISEDILKAVLLPNNVTLNEVTERSRSIRVK